MSNREDRPARMIALALIQKARHMPRTHHNCEKVVLELVTNQLVEITHHRDWLSDDDKATIRDSFETMLSIRLEQSPQRVRSFRTTPCGRRFMIAYDSELPTYVRPDDTQLDRVDHRLNA